MERMTRGRALLMELTLAALFLAISATVILRLFLLSHTTARESRLVDLATAEAQNWAERLSCADEADAFLLGKGFRASGEGYVLQADGGLDVLIKLSAQETNQGRLESADISVLNDGETLIEIAQRRYLPGEVD